MARQDTRSISKMIQDNKNNKAERNVQNVELDSVAVALDKPELEDMLMSLGMKMPAQKLAARPSLQASLLLKEGSLMINVPGTNTLFSRSHVRTLNPAAPRISSAFSPVLL